MEDCTAVWIKQLGSESHKQGGPEDLVAGEVWHEDWGCTYYPVRHSDAGGEISWNIYCDQKYTFLSKSVSKHHQRLFLWRFIPNCRENIVGQA